MTPAMQKIVEAMVAELTRQAKENCEHVLPLGASCSGDMQMDGDFDLKKVARTALTDVLREAFEEGFDAGRDYADFREGKYRPVEDPPGPAVAARIYVAATLGEQP